MAAGLMDKRDRIRGVFNRMDSADQGADIAFGIADKALRTAEVSWTDLLDCFFEKKDREGSSRSGAGGMFRGFGFDTMGRGRRPRPGEPEKPSQPFRRLILAGDDIPTEISGAIEEIDRRTSQGRAMVVVNVNTSDGTSYGPLAIFNEADIARLDKSKKKIFSGRVSHATDPRNLPKFSQLRD